MEHCACVRFLDADEKKNTITFWKNGMCFPGMGVTVNNPKTEQHLCAKLEEKDFIRLYRWMTKLARNWGPLQHESLMDKINTKRKINLRQRLLNPKWKAKIARVRLMSMLEV